MPKQCNGDDVLAQVLQIMVQHVEDLDMQDVARLLQLSSTCRRALQQAVGCLKLVDYRFSKMAATAGLAAWLPDHAGLVQALHLTRPWIGDPQEAVQAAVAAEQVVVFALQITTIPQGVPTAAAGPPKPPSRPAPLLRLQSFSSNYIHSPAALRSLAACSFLTELKLTDIPQQRCTAAFCGAIRQLRSLRRLELHLSTQDAAAVLPSSFGAAVAQLTQLEVLHVKRLPSAALSQLPSSLTEALLEVDHTGSSPVDINMSHLNRLLSLELTVPGQVGAQLQLPASLTALDLEGEADAVPGLGQLQYLHLHRPAACLALLQRLPQLPVLQQVKVRLQHCRQDQLEPVLAALSAGTKLTGLQLYWCDPYQELDGSFGAGRGLADMRNISMHSYLKKLPRLQLLHMSGMGLNPADVVHFTALTALTDLRFASFEGKLDLGMAATMQRLTGLRKLCLHSLEVRNSLIWVAAASLTNLQHLECILCNRIAVTDDTLHLLAPLTRLTHLTIDSGFWTTHDGPPYETFTCTVSDDAKHTLLRQLPLLKEVNWVE